MSKKTVEGDNDFKKTIFKVITSHNTAYLLTVINKNDE